MNGLPERLGMCRTCLRWRDYESGQCPVCGNVLDIAPWELTRENELELAELLLAGQDIYDLHAPKENDDEELRVWRKAMDPRFVLNTSVQDIRRMIGLLRGQLAQHGIYVGQHTDAGDEIEVDIAGERWRAFRRKRDGHIVPIAKIDPVPPAAVDAGSNRRLHHTHGKQATAVAGCPACDASSAAVAVA